MSPLRPLTRLIRNRFALVASVAFGLIMCSVSVAENAEMAANGQVRVRLAMGLKEIAMQTQGPLTVGGGTKGEPLPEGAYTISVTEAKPARQRFHVFVKTFLPSEKDQANEYMTQWKQQGYQPETTVFGKRLKGDKGGVIDNRSLWVSVARLDSIEKANALKKQLESQSVWGWIQAETVRQGAGGIVVRNAKGKIVAKAQVPVALESRKPIEIRNVDRGFWKSDRGAHTYAGTLGIGVGPDGLLELYETLPIEDYVAGVLPAEMPAGWPVEALKAQAVAARSEVIASMAGKHMLEGFDFCGTEHCRAYLGAGGRQASTDAAVAQTAGVVLRVKGRVLPTVFSANCGGWTEDNETVWAAPPNPGLRAVDDFAAGRNPASKGIRKYGIAKWIKGSPPAYCSANKEHFRWTRRFSAHEIGDIVNKRYAVGAVKAIEPGDRGPGGRLKSVKVVGSKKTEVIRKELNIRLAFGGLNSAMFVVETEGPAGKAVSFTFFGGGRGHGVGLCQDGARGMALAGVSWRDILSHYFAGANMVRLGG